MFVGLTPCGHWRLRKRRECEEDVAFRWKAREREEMVGGAPPSIGRSNGLLRPELLTICKQVRISPREPCR